MPSTQEEFLRLYLPMVMWHIQEHVCWLQNVHTCLSRWNYEVLIYWDMDMKCNMSGDWGKLLNYWMSKCCCYFIWIYRVTLWLLVKTFSSLSPLSSPLWSRTYFHSAHRLEEGKTATRVSSKSWKHLLLQTLSDLHAASCRLNLCRKKDVKRNIADRRTLWSRLLLIPFRMSSWTTRHNDYHRS